MTHLTAVVTVLANTIDKRMTHLDLHARLPLGPLTLEAFTPLGDRVTPFQMAQIHTGVLELRRAFSSQLLTHLIVRQVNVTTLARADVASDEAKTRLENGGVLVSLPSVIDFEGQGSVGRPDATPIDDALKQAFAQAVSRISRLAIVADNDQYERFEDQYRALGQRLEAQASLFNLNAGHKNYNEFPVLNWCETHGPAMQAAAYGLEENALDTALDTAFIARLKIKPFENLLADELGRVETLLAWSNAHSERKRGEASRRDSTRRTLKKDGFDWQTAPGAIDPPRMHGSVRRNLVAETAMANLDPSAMVKAAVLFDLEPAYGFFLTRLYLLPILAAAGLAGRVGLRRQPGTIASPILAGGLVALAERSAAGGNDGSGQADGDASNDEIGTHQGLLDTLFERSGLSVTELGPLGREFLKTGQPMAIDPPTGPQQFFLDD